MPDDSGKHTATSPSIFVKLAELRKDVNQLQAHDLASRKDISALQQAATEHRMRLENGTHVFSALKDEIADLDARTTPRAPSVLKIVAITLALVTAGAGALWGLSNMLRDRPTLEQVDKVMDKHQANGHKATHEQIESIKHEQYEQRTLIKDVKTEQLAQDEKLDTLLDRVPEPRRRPPR